MPLLFVDHVLAEGLGVGAQRPFLAGRDVFAFNVLERLPVQAVVLKQHDLPPQVHAGGQQLVELFRPAHGAEDACTVIQSQAVEYRCLGGQSQGQFANSLAAPG